MTDHLSDIALTHLERQLTSAIESGAAPGPLTARRLVAEQLPRMMEVIRDVRQSRAEIRRADERADRFKAHLRAILDALRAQAVDSNGIGAAVEVWSGRTTRGVPFQSWPPSVRRLHDALAAAEAALRTDT